MGFRENQRHPRRNHLSFSGQPRHTETIDQIASLVGPLPESAWKYSAWRANNANVHVNAGAWLAAGYRVDTLDQSRGMVPCIESC